MNTTAPADLHQERKDHHEAHGDCLHEQHGGRHLLTLPTNRRIDMSLNWIDVNEFDFNCLLLMNASNCSICLKRRMHSCVGI